MPEEDIKKDETVDVSEQLDEAAKIDMIYETLCEAPNGTALAQEYLDFRAQAENSIGNVKVLSEVNEKLRQENARLNLEIRETRRLLDGREPKIIEVEKRVEVPKVEEPKPQIKEPSIEDIVKFFED